MQQDNKHTDKKLQELEKQSLPDLSRMDEDWQRMKNLLEPTSRSLPVKSRPLKRYMRWMIAAVFLGGLFLVTYKLADQTKKRDNHTITKNPVAIVPAQGDTTSSVTINTGKNENANQHTRIYMPSKAIKVRNPHENESKPNLIPVNDQPDPPALDPKVSLAEFFRQLEKPGQEFLINNNRDTVITGRDGTALLIPANTLNTKGTVNISLKEYYSYEDIITNKLTTTSNDEQLVTGGMLFIEAMADGKQVEIIPGKTIRWFIPDTTKEMIQMKLFTGERTARLSMKRANNILNQNEDEYRVSTSSADGINWIPQEQFFMGGYLSTRVKVLDLRNEPLKLKRKKNGMVGIFRIADDPKISEEELAIALKEKYGYYKVKIKRDKELNFFRKLMPGFIKTVKFNLDQPVGDSAWLDINIARMYNLPATDTSISAPGVSKITNNAFDRWMSSGMDTVANYNTVVAKTTASINRSLDKLAERFSVDIRKLGWINCDRFLNDNRPKVDFYVDLKDTASNYYTFLVFENIRSMINGRIFGNKVVFSRVPEGSKAKVISVGIQQGKPVVAMEKIEISGPGLTNLKFEPSDPVSFREQTAALDK